MLEVVVQDVRFIYETAGEGFPLVLAPGPQGSQEVWSQSLPLLSELCRTIAYECQAVEGAAQPAALHTAPDAAETLGTFLAALGLTRVYLASHSVGWPMALHFALQHPERLEGLVLVGASAVEPDTVCGVLSLQTRLHEITVPALVLLEAQAHAAWPDAALLTERLPRCTQIVLADSSPLPSSSPPALQLGHSMMRFLLHCERQRNLVRGASFLL